VKSRSLLAATIAMAAMASMATATPAIRPASAGPRGDPFKPSTRYRGSGGSPAQRLMERQRQKNQKRNKS